MQDRDAGWGSGVEMQRLGGGVLGTAGRQHTQGQSHGSWCVDGRTFVKKQGEVSGEYEG